MPDDHSENKRAIVPIAADKQQLTLPSEMVTRGLELAIRIEHRYGIQPHLYTPTRKEYMARCYPTIMEGTQSNDSSSVTTPSRAGESRRPIYVVLSVDKDGIYISCVSPRHNLSFAGIENNEVRYRLLNNGSDPIAIPMSSADLYYIVVTRRQGNLKFTMCPTGRPGYRGAIPRGVMPKGPIFYPRNIDEIEIIIIYRSLLKGLYPQQTIVEMRSPLKLDLVVIDNQSEYDPAATRELYNAMLSAKNSVTENGS